MLHSQNSILTIQTFPNKGRGVITKQTIEANTVLEVAPVASFPTQERPIIDKTQIAKYYFVQPEAYEETKQVEGYFIFGLASFCNHHDKPNAKIEWKEDEKGLWAHLTTTKAISANEEVTLYYTNLDEYNF